MKCHVSLSYRYITCHRTHGSSQSSGSSIETTTLESVSGQGGADCFSWLSSGKGNHFSCEKTYDLGQESKKNPPKNKKKTHKKHTHTHTDTHTSTHTKCDVQKRSSFHTICIRCTLLCCTFTSSCHRYHKYT